MSKTVVASTDVIYECHTSERWSQNFQRQQTWMLHSAVPCQITSMVRRLIILFEIFPRWKNSKGVDHQGKVFENK